MSLYSLSDSRTRDYTSLQTRDRHSYSTRYRLSYRCLYFSYWYSSSKSFFLPSCFFGFRFSLLPPLLLSAISRLWFIVFVLVRFRQAGGSLSVLLAGFSLLGAKLSGG